MTLNEVLTLDRAEDLLKGTAETGTPETILCPHTEYCTLGKINPENCINWENCPTVIYYKRK